MAAAREDTACPDHQTGDGAYARDRPGRRDVIGPEGARARWDTEDQRGGRGGTISGDPYTTDVRTRPVAKRLATGRALAATTSFCIRARCCERCGTVNIINTTRFSLAAHVLSSSCANSGVVCSGRPGGVHVPDARLPHLLRFGLPCVMPLDQWRCNCSAQAGPRHSAFVERVVEPDETAGTFAAEPLHGMYCLQRWMRVMKRHDNIRDALSVPGAGAQDPGRPDHARTEGGEPTV